jgi:hypothetical protein
VTESLETVRARGLPPHAPPNWIVALPIVGAALVATAPLLARGNSCGHDFNFHLLSWMETARAWHNGLAYPHWVEDANYGAGEPRLIFYPPASWILGGLLGSTFSWAAAPILFVLLALLGGGAAMYLLAREWVSSESAVFAACLYVVNPYALFVVYERSAFGELLAGAVLPLVVLFALRRSRGAAALGVAIAATWLCDAPAAVMASYMLAVIALILTLLEGKAWPALRAAGGMALALGLTALYIVPAAYERGWVQIARAVSDPGARVQDGFLFTHTADRPHDQVLLTVSWIFVVEAAVGAGAAWLAMRRVKGSRARIAIISLLPLILFLQLPASRAVWQALPELKFMQFPWRWVLVVSVAACVLIGMALDARSVAEGPGSSLWLRRAGAGLVVLTLVAGGESIFFQPCDEEDAVVARLAAFRAGPTEAGVEGSDEYTLRGADNSAIQQDLPFVRVLKSAQDDEADESSVQAANPEWRPNAAGALAANVTVSEKNAERWSIRIESSAGGHAVLRLMDYPAWQVTLNGKAVQDRPQRADGLMTIPLAAGSNAIEIRWRATADAIAGDAISAASLSLLILLGIGGRLTPRARPSPRPLPWW